jgi:hypothetical protein
MKFGWVRFTRSKYKARDRNEEMHGQNVIKLNLMFGLIEAYLVQK